MRQRIIWVRRQRTRWDTGWGCIMCSRVDALLLETLWKIRLHRVRLLAGVRLIRIAVRVVVLIPFTIK